MLQLYIIDYEITHRYAATFHCRMTHWYLVLKFCTSGRDISLGGKIERIQINKEGRKKFESLKH